MSPERGDSPPFPPRAAVDASFVLNFLLPDERAYPATRDAFLRFVEGDMDMISSPLLPYEVGNVLAVALRKGRITERLAFQLYEQFLKLGIRVVEVDARFVLEMAVRSGITVYDASYLCVSRIAGAPLLTYDQRLAKLARE